MCAFVKVLDMSCKLKSVSPLCMEMLSLRKIVFHHSLPNFPLLSLSDFRKVYTGTAHQSLDRPSMVRPMKSSLSANQAERWVKTLKEEERAFLLQALLKQQQLNPTKDSQSTSEDVSSKESLPTSPSLTELRKVAVHYAIPFVGFGFLDNFIMIVAGDYIDITIGTALGISTMAAAALGNAISDVAGVGSAWYVENVAGKLGIPIPNLTPEQLTMRSARWATHAGRAIGVAIGCILGMIPLLFLPGRDKEEDDKKTIS